MGWMTGVQFQLEQWLDFFCSPSCPDQIWSPASLWSSGYRGLLPCHSPPYSAKFKKVWSCTWMPLYVFMVSCLVKHSDKQLYLYFSTFIGYWEFFSPRGKQPGRETDHTPPSSAEVKNAWYTTASPYVFMAWCSIKHRLSSWCGT